MKTEYLTEDQEWFNFYPKFNSSFYVEKAAYFDERPQIHTSVTQLLALFTLPFMLTQSWWFLFLLPLVFFGWGALYIHLPIRTGIQDCESACWGFNYHDNKIWIYIGGGGNFEGGRKWKTITMPTLLKDGKEWFIETQKERLPWDKTKEINYDWLQNNKWKETHSYLDKYDNTIVNATISVEEREWRPLGFQWTKLFTKVRRSIDVDFDKEVGKQKGSWKGGTIGCGYTLLPNETPLECLRRMEKERKF